MISNRPALNRFVSPGPGGCIPIVGALISVLLRRRRDEPGKDGDDA